MNHPDGSAGPGGRHELAAGEDGGGRLALRAIANGRNSAEDPLTSGGGLRMAPTGRLRLGRQVALTFATMALVATCSSVTPTPIPFDQERIFLPSDIAGHAPNGWIVHETKLDIFIPYGGPVFLSNEPFPDPCSGSTVQNVACMSFPPQVQLGPDGVIVGFEYQRQLLGVVVFPEPSGVGDVITLNGFRTKVLRQTPGACGPMGADETLSILIPSLADWTGRTTVEACLQGPDLVGNEAKLLAMVRAATAK